MRWLLPAAAGRLPARGAGAEPGARQRSRRCGDAALAGESRAATHQAVRGRRGARRASSTSGKRETGPASGLPTRARIGGWPWAGRRSHGSLDDAPAGTFAPVQGCGQQVLRVLVRHLRVYTGGRIQPSRPHGLCARRRGKRMSFQARAERPGAADRPPLTLRLGQGRPAAADRVELRRPVRAAPVTEVQRSRFRSAPPTFVRPWAASSRVPPPTRRPSALPAPPAAST